MRIRTIEATLAVSEQFGLDQQVGQPFAIQHCEPVRRSITLLMNESSHHSLADAASARNQHVRVPSRRHERLALDTANRRAAAKYADARDFLMRG